MQNINPLHLIDGYKADHRSQYPKGTTEVYSNLTPRQSRVDGVNEVIFFGLQYFIQEYLLNMWNDNFFNQPKEKVVSEYKRRIKNYLGPDAITYEHMEALHDLGYLPIKIKALSEGTCVPIGIPVLTIVNTHPDFFWLTNYFETLLSNILWKPITSATTAFQYRKRFEEYSKLTGYSKACIQWQGHDFSFRGMSGIEDAVMSGAAHLLSFTGTDSIPSIDFLEKYYDADCEKELIGGSVPATEHSVMCMGQKDNEFETFKRLITQTYSSGIVSIVSDTWDFWKVITEYLPALKNEILNRDGRVVIRPDSGDPADIICGVQCRESEEAYYTEAQLKGTYELLYEIFGGTINKEGYIELHPSIGLIYGDSITLNRQKNILERLQNKGFSASNLVLGIGSFTYEYVTRDTFGFAMKATSGIVNGQRRDIFKNPKTDSGFKKSAKGLLCVLKDDEKGLVLIDECTETEESQGELKTVFVDGRHTRTTLKEIRDKINNYFE